MSAQTFVQLTGITKNFGGVHALKGVDLEITAGEIVALVGHNGAGKSVLVQILSGVFPPTSGEIRVMGAPVNFHSPNDARHQGIETIYQTLALADNLDAPSNFFLGRELRTRFGFLDKRRMAEAAGQALADLNPAFTEIERPVRQMSGGQRQAVAIARAIHFRRARSDHGRTDGSARPPTKPRRSVPSSGASRNRASAYSSSVTTCAASSILPTGSSC